MIRHLQHASLLCAALLLASGCFGPFNLTRRVYRWNERIGDKWEREFLFILLTWTPVYGFAVAADAIAFNSIEFWTGDNPVEPPGTRAMLDERRLVRGADEVVMTRGADGAAELMTIQLYDDGAPAGTLTAQRRPGQPVTAADAQGHTLFTAQTLDDGGIAVDDGRGRRVATYSAREVERAIRTIRQEPR